MIERIGEYEVRFELGKGGFGHVYLAFDPRVGRLVAIKVLKAEGDSSLISRFKTEATAAGNLRHKNIVTVYEYGEDKGMQYLVMEYLDGQDLHRVIEGKQPLTLLQKMEIMSQVAEGLHCAHQNKVVHRDVKPANIMVLSDGSVKIMDFGIARLMREGATRLTQSGFMVGTVSYMAPEQFSGSEVDVLCDIWAYGVIYYQLLTGEHPFPGADLGTMMYAITGRDPQPVRSLCPECPETLERVITRLLSKDRESRYQTLEDVQFDATPVLRELQREHASALLGQASGLLRTQKLDEAGALARKILELDPANPEARRLRELVQDRIKQRSARPRVLNLLKQAESEEARHNYIEAIRIVDSALRLAPQDTEIQLRLDELLAVRARVEQAGRLLEQAKEQLDLRNITGAFRALTAALETDPGNAEAQRLLEQVREEREVEERRRRRSEGLSRAKGLLGTKAFDEASELLSRLAVENPDSAEVQEMIDRLHRERKEDQARQQLQADIAACRELLKRGEFEEAIARLEPLGREFSQESQIPDLIAYARDELRTKERDQHCERIGREAWAFFKAQNFDRALQILEDGLRTYPGEPKLLNVMQRVADGKAEYEKALLEEQLRRDLERSEQEREQHQRELDKAGAQQKESGLKKALSLVAEREAARDWDGALALVEQAIERHGAAMALVNAAGRILTRKSVTEGVSNIEQTLALGDWASARSLLDSAKSDYSDEYDWAALEEKVQAAQASSRRDVLDKAQKLLLQGDIDQAALSARDLLQQNPNDAEAVKLLGTIQEHRAQLERAQRDLQTTKASAEDLAIPGKKRSRTLLWVAAVAAVLIAGGILWKVSGGRSGKLAVKPTQVSFVSTSGGAVPGPATVTVDSPDPARKWDVSVSDDWISAARQGSAVVVAVNPRELGTGTHTGHLIIAAEDGRDRNEVVVKLTIQPAPAVP
jgi:serine/threonine protein kinase